MLCAIWLVMLTGCLITLPDGSGIRMTVDAVSVGEMPDKVPGHREQIEETVLSLGEIAVTGLSPVAGALLYQFLLRPLRRRREERNGKNKKVDV